MDDGPNVASCRPPTRDLPPQTARLSCDIFQLSTNRQFPLDIANHGQRYKRMVGSLHNSPVDYLRAGGGGDVDALDRVAFPASVIWRTGGVMYLNFGPNAPCVPCGWLKHSRLLQIARRTGVPKNSLPPFSSPCAVFVGFGHRWKRDKSSPCFPIKTDAAAGANGLKYGR